MELQPIENELFGFDSDGNLTHSSLPTEEINNRNRYDFYLSEAFYEIDVADLNMTMYPTEDFRKILQDIQTVVQSNDFSDSVTSNEIDELITEFSQELHSTESNNMADQIQSTDEQLAMIKTNNSTLPVTRSTTEKCMLNKQHTDGEFFSNTSAPFPVPVKPFDDQSILLSNSVAVTIPSPVQLQLVHPLEDTYRARYKSDYFPQKGPSRRPRYVADSQGRHFVTLQMPTKYHRDLTSGYLRVALLTTSIDNQGHFYSPYKFQTNHRDAKVPDCNPIYLPVQSLGKNHSELKLQLVLIKSKLDQLNEAQPLKPFFDGIRSVINIISETRLAPKDLINTYQLDKSHLAFTLCTKLPDGTYDVHPETTIISSVINEVTAKSTPGAKKTSELVTPASTGKKVCCPKCAHSFELAESERPKKATKRRVNSGALQTTSQSSTEAVKRKKKRTA